MAFCLLSAVMLTAAAARAAALAAPTRGNGPASAAAGVYGSLPLLATTPDHGRTSASNAVTAAVAIDGRDAELRSIDAAWLAVERASGAPLVVDGRKWVHLGAHVPPLISEGWARSASSFRERTGGAGGGFARRAQATDNTVYNETYFQQSIAVLVSNENGLTE
jgi:hypothetical protein